MYNLEVVLVHAANTTEAEPYRYTEQVASLNIAEATARALIARMASGSYTTHQPTTRPDGKYYVYTSGHGIIGYANIVEVAETP